LPHRLLVTRELAALFAVLGHPHRIRIIEELRDGECDVKSLQIRLGIKHCGVSQHLMVLRAHRIVCERRQGRHVFYRLRQPGMASWLLEATEFLEQESENFGASGGNQEDSAGMGGEVSSSTACPSLVPQGEVRYD
jgi:DNA-binding transcriptional ArsR family regulator